MLWIQFEATKNMKIAYVKQIAIAIAGFVVPYSVAIFDVGEFGLGLICHREVCSDEDTKSESPGIESISDFDELDEGNYDVGKAQVDDAIENEKHLQTSMLRLTALTPDPEYGQPISSPNVPEIESNFSKISMTDATITSTISLGEKPRITFGEEDSGEDQRQQESSTEGSPAKNGPDQPQEHEGNDNDNELSGQSDDESPGDPGKESLRSSISLAKPNHPKKLPAHSRA